MVPLKRIPVSAFIIARDEAERLPATLASLRDLVDEIIVVEWGSQDDTVAIAIAGGARVFHNPWTGYGAQKRFAEDQCRHRWLLNLDADEALSPELQAAIRSQFERGLPDCDGFRLVIRAVCPHEERPRRWAYANTPIRLYDRERGRFSASPVHDSVLMPQTANIRQLRGDVYHRGMLSFDQLMAKINGYTSMQANEACARSARPVTWWRLATVFPAAFLKSFVFRRHFVWGRYGFAISMCYAMARLLRLAKMHEFQLRQEGEFRQNSQRADEVRRPAA